MNTNLLMALAFSYLIYGNSALAAPVEIPNCWKESGAQLEDGGFLVGVEAGNLSGKELVKALDLMDGKYLRASNFPLIFDTHVIVHTTAIDYGVGQNKLPRKEFIKAVTAELKTVVDTGAVTYIECNGISFPQPGSTVHN